MLDQFRISKKHIPIITLVALAIIAVLMRIPFLGYESADYTTFLLPWYTHLSQFGFSAFHDNFANYNFPYLYVLWLLSALHLPPLIAIKVTSFLFEIALAVAVYLIIRHYRPKGWLAPFAGVLVLFLPTIFMNSSLWDQCDGIYAALVLFSFYALLKERRIAAWLFWGAAFAFKIQAIFFLPVLIYLWLTSKKSRLYDPFIGFIPFALSCVPALFAGQALDSVLAVYFIQGNFYPYLSANGPSLYGLTPFGPSAFIQVGQLVTIAAVGSLIALAVLKMKTSKNQRYWLVLATVSVLLVPFLMPQMHERYFYLAEVFSFILAVLSIRTIWIAAAIQFASGVMYLVQYLPTNQLPVSLPVVSIVMGGALIGLVYYYLKHFTTVSLHDSFVAHK